MIKITHIINPVKVSESSDLFIAQPVTFETIRRAKFFAKENVNVNIVTTQYPEDHQIIPDYFTKTLDLNRSILDFNTFEKKRKLPLLKDILQNAVNFDENSNYIVYTNSDIALMPHFYLYLEEKIKKGYDAFVINRRTIKNYKGIEELSLMYSDLGEIHPGYDCFVFKKEMFKKFIIKNSCIGIRYIGLILFLNLKLHAKKFNEFDNEHLTFHIGNDRIWRNKDFNKYELYNKNEFEKIKKELNQKFDNVEEAIEFSLRYWKKNKIPKWKKYLIHILAKDEISKKNN